MSNRDLPPLGCPWGKPTHYVLVAPAGSTYVKEAEFFRQQGGLTDKWGENWRPVVADSFEAARTLGKQLAESGELEIQWKLERVGFMHWEWKGTVPSLKPGRPPLMSAALGPFRTKWGGLRAKDMLPGVSAVSMHGLRERFPQRTPDCRGFWNHCHCCDCIEREQRLEATLDAATPEERRKLIDEMMPAIMAAKGIKP